MPIKKTGFTLLLLMALVWAARADHITGGTIFYTYTSNENGQYQYAVTMKIYMRCNSGREFNDPAIVSLFDRATGNRVKDLSVSLTSSETIFYNNTNPCITQAPQVCYVVGYYKFNISVLPNDQGYLLASQVNYRIQGINNLASNYGLIGATYTAEIPGTGQTPDSYHNNSPVFTGTDLVLICEFNSFSYDFSAADTDGDELRYYFCQAYESKNAGGGPGGPGGGALPAGNPPYSSVPYGPGYSSFAPLGIHVQINSKTGLVTGIAPSQGVYVITVCVDEIRNGKVIATQRKDLQVNIASCSIAAATLAPEQFLCRNSSTIQLADLSSSPLIQTYDWQIFDALGNQIFESHLPADSFTVADTGVYRIKLLINQGKPCSDSTASLARVYPGFIPDFTFTGICVNKPTRFSDATQSVYGVVNSWDWDFGDGGGSGTHLPNPVYTYGSLGTRRVILQVTNSLGCHDTASRLVSIIDRPPIALAFADTLICSADPLTLAASGDGQFSWSPAAGMLNPLTGTPTVHPGASTVYVVQLNSNGCINSDSVKVRVVDHVSLQAMPDTVICQGDSLRLHLLSDGLRYSWNPAALLDDPGRPDPGTRLFNSQVFVVTALIGSCSASAALQVSTVPYPSAAAGADTVICYNGEAQLHGTTDGNRVLWSPAQGLDNPGRLDPVARPAVSTAYILLAYDNRGCPKPGTDTVNVVVLPPIVASAGRDTNVVVGQPLQLHASGGSRYLWSPAGPLSPADSSDPVAVFLQPNAGTHFKVRVYNFAGCYDSAAVTVKVYASRPAVFVPNAFTPNGDGKNDRLRPIPVGIQVIQYFRIYNRFGQLLYNSTDPGGGWDGSFGGKPQPVDTYVWVVYAVDYTGAVFARQGTVTLLR